MEQYKNYLVTALQIKSEDADLFLSGFETVLYKKGDFLLREGEKCSIVRIILEGCARGFIIKDGKEFTTNFYFEYDHCYDYINYLLKEKSNMNIQALDSVKAIEIKLEAIEFIQSERIDFHRMSFHMFRMNVIKLESERQKLIIKTPKERYLDLINSNSQIISRVPQHQVASFIGISPEHLSRIRKELFSI